MSLSIRIIPYLSCKGNRVVKGISMEGLRPVGEPMTMAKRYYDQGADEILYTDVVASLYGRRPMDAVITGLAEKIFIPLTVCGGIGDMDAVRAMFHCGAEKVCINTAAIGRPELITEIAKQYGCQAVMVGIEYINGRCMTNAGREHTGLDAMDWAKRAIDLGAGELLMTSIERDGTRKGFDLKFLAEAAKLPVPVIAHGGAGSLDDCVKVAQVGVAGIALGTMLHYGEFTVGTIKAALAAAGEPVRT